MTVNKNRAMLDAVDVAHGEWIRQGWVEAADGMAAVLELVRAHRILTDRIEQALKPTALTFARYEILMVLSFTKRGSLSIGSLGHQLQVHSTSITSTVDRLEEQGLADRVRNERDRRVVMVQITPQGRRIATAATEALNDHVFTELGLTAKQGIRLWALLRSFRANAGDFDVVGDRARRTG
jgi:DNA-binding MarR family transcriptional regulator